MKISVCIFLLFFSLDSFEQNIHYVLAAPNAVHHEAEISVTADKLPAGPVYFRMSRSSPGRYATHEFGKNVYNVQAYNSAGKPLRVEKEDADVYKILDHQGTIKVTYTLYANYADGTYTSIDASGLHLNMPSTFMWVKGMHNIPITIQFIPLDREWRVATQLRATADPFTFTAPGLQYFMDSPVKIGTLQFRQWKMFNPDRKEYTFSLALEGEASHPTLDSLAHKVRKVVEQAKAVFGEFPRYDYGTYTFIASFSPYVHGDGMEHRNSTMITIPDTLNSGNNFLDVFAHEFFHCWNVERIRPYQLEPFNFEKSNMSDGLWMAEGFTQYYGDLLVKRAGLISENGFLEQMAHLVNTRMNSPGAYDYTPIENSERAVFVDAGVSIDNTNYPNMYGSYYTYGAALALALDLELRSKFANKSLDDMMRVLWHTHGKSEKPYTVPDLQTALSSITNQNYAATFFKKYVYGHDYFDYETALLPAGLHLSPVNKGKAWIGQVSFVADRNDLMIATNTIKNTPLYKSGADIGDVIVSLAGKNLTGKKDLNDALMNHRPGEKVKLVFKHRNKRVTTDIELSENNLMQIRPIGSLMVNEKAAVFKAAWMSASNQ